MSMDKNGASGHRDANGVLLTKEREAFKKNDQT